MILTVIVITALCLSVIFFLTSRFLIAGAQNKYQLNMMHKPYEPDELFVKENEVDQVNRVFETSGHVHEFIDRYIISLQGKQRILILKYQEAPKEVYIKINLYSKNGIFIDAYVLKEYTDQLHSNEIKLPLNASLINLEILSKEKLDTLELFNQDAKIRSKKKIALAYSLSTLCMMIPLAYGLVFILDRLHLDEILNLSNSLFILSIMILLTIIHYRYLYRKYVVKVYKVGDRS